ncbi:unnamed protein product [Closterium sp. Naga37s-1]|nr:unnamed protein product [Closterium sp. Naga37s-1]
MHLRGVVGRCLAAYPLPLFSPYHSTPSPPALPPQVPPRCRWWRTQQAGGWPLLTAYPLPPSLPITPPPHPPHFPLRRLPSVAGASQVSLVAHTAGGWLASA